jgi:predicted ATPase with chaperone activity
LPGAAIVDLCQMGKAARNALAELSTLRQLSARSTHRVLRVARSIADLNGHEAVADGDVLAAGVLRDPAIHEESLAA